MSSLRTFIVEDSAIILDNLVATLEELADVKVVGSALDEKSAIDWIRNASGSVDLVIVDIFLKSGSGLGVLRAVQEAGLVGRRVVLTNYATADIRRRCLALGADRVFDKSGELEDLIDYCSQMAGDRAGDSARVPGESG